MQNGIYVEENIFIWGYLHNERVFCYKVLFIIYQDLPFGGFALKIKLVISVYELIIYLWNYLLLLGYVIISLWTTQPSNNLGTFVERQVCLLHQFC